MEFQKLFSSCCSARVIWSSHTCLFCSGSHKLITVYTEYSPESHSTVLRISVHLARCASCSTPFSSLCCVDSHSSKPHTCGENGNLSIHIYVCVVCVYYTNNSPIHIATLAQETRQDTKGCAPPTSIQKWNKLSQKSWVHQRILREPKCVYHSFTSSLPHEIPYRIAGKFGGDLNLAVWRSGLKPPN